MLVTILNYNFSTPSAATLSVVLKTDSNGVLDISTSTPDKSWFTLENYTTATPSTITITSVSLGTSPTNGELTITFDSSASSVSVGDVLVLSGSSITPTSPYSRIVGTASIDTGLDVIPDTGSNQFIRVPKTNRTSTKSYNLSLDFVENNSTVINPQVIPLSTPITIAGKSIGSIKVTAITSETTFSGNEPFEFKVLFYESSDATGEPLIFDAATDDILSISFKPL